MSLGDINYISDDSGEFYSLPSIDDSPCEDSFHSTQSSIPLNVALNSHFSDSLKNFNVIHLNAQSIPAHYPDMLASFESRNIHAILVSESWLKPCLPSTSYSIPGFHLIRNDRIGRGGGGVAIYLRSYIPFTIISLSTQPPPSNAAEHLLIEVTMAHTKILLGVCYSHSLHIDYFSSLECLLENLIPLYSHTIIMGDFNTCLLKGDSRSKKLQSVTDTYNLQILPLSATHNLPDCTPSLLDLIIVSSPDLVLKYGQLEANCFSYHDLLFLTYKVRPPKAKSRMLLLRNFSGMDKERLAEDARLLDWSAVAEATTVDLKVEVFNSLITQLYDVHAPVKLVKIKHLPAPWLTDNLKTLIMKKGYAKSKLKSDKSEENLRKYNKARNRCNTSCRDAQRRHIHKSVENGDTAKVWKFLKSLGVGKASPSISHHNTNIELLNQHFSTSSAIDSSDKLRTLSILSSMPTPTFQPFYFTPFTDCDVKKNILSISSNAVGDDCISRNMILPILEIVTPILTHILNDSITTSKFPEAWKNARVTPLPKKVNASHFSDFRPISILPFLSKVLEKLVFHQLYLYLNRNCLLNPFQSGFRSGHSTTTALVKVTDDIRRGMDNKQLTLLVLLDFSNAFNSVDFDILLSLLRSINISQSVVGWFQSYLSGRRQRICIDDKFSSWCELRAGVPQGGVLSPLLFAIFINSISRTITSLYHMYADDVQVYTQSTLETLPSAVATINCDLAAINVWSKHYGLSINPNKSQAIIIGGAGLVSRVDWDNLPSVSLNGVVIPYSTTVKNLGVHLDCTLSWSNHLKELSRKTFGAMGSLRRLRSFLPIPTKIMLAQSLLLPILDYADVSYLDLTEDQLNKLERIQNLAIRFIFGLRKYDHVSEFRSKLKWLPIRFRRNLHIVTLLYCVLFNPMTPSYLKENFKFLGHDRPGIVLRSAGKFTLAMPTHRTKYFKNSFAFKAISLWNQLPSQIHRAKTLTKFKIDVKKYYLSLCDNSDIVI